MWSQITNYISYVIDAYGLLPICLELLIIGLVVHAVIAFLHGTGGEKLLKGIILLLIGVWTTSLLAGSETLDLQRINLLLKYFLVSVLFVGTVAFQPELRRGLMHLGVTRFGRNAAPVMAHVIEEVVDAVATLSRKQTGALIAFERDVKLGDLTGRGTSVGAAVTADLLHTIFWPGTPLHDMGVVIRRGRIAAAAVQFPLAEYGEYDRLLGSRHRAAIGLSKESDAVVVVVSEESGQIGLAINGKLTRFLTIEQLRQRLIDLIMPMVEQKPGHFEWLKRLFRMGRAGEGENAKSTAVSSTDVSKAAARRSVTIAPEPDDEPDDDEPDNDEPATGEAAPREGSS